MSTEARATRDALEAVRNAPTLLAGLDLLDAVVTAARAEGPAAAGPLADAIGDPHDALTAIVAVHGAAAAGAATAGQLVVPLLTAGPPHLTEHAAWALGRSPRVFAAVPALQDLADAGGLPGTLAEATLEAWGLGVAGSGPEDVGRDSHRSPGHDPRQLGETSESAPAAAASPTAVPAPAASAPPGPGLTVAQLYLHADLDGSLRHAGQGDTGGIATLLVHLGDALLAEGTATRVLTMSRGRPGEPREPDDLAAAGHHYPAIPLPGPVRHAADAWPLRDAARRGLRRVLRAAGRVDVLHLRMADVGSWAAAEVARELGIPTVLTLAPDPHALVAAREASGSLTRATFGAADAAEHLVFRIRLLRDLAEQAAHLVVFPRPDLARDLRDLLHLDPDDAHRVTVVPEGIDLVPLERAAREVADALRGGPVAPDTAAALADLDTLLAALPDERRDLPLAITVGRLHRVKGMATLVETWASDPALAARCNLLVVGGDLEHPSGDEREQLGRIDAAVPRSEGPARGLLLAGHRPNGVVATWLAAVRAGRPGLAAPAGVYVSASVKEEFGIAILEALASGLVVVAPDDGGPATYVEHGVTGVLADTTDRGELGGALASALDLASAPDADARADRARRLVEDRFSIATMASALAAIYREVTHDPARHQS